MKCPIHGTSDADTVLGCVECLAELLRASIDQRAPPPGWASGVKPRVCSECSVFLEQRIDPSTRCKTCRQRLYRKHYGETFDGHIPRSTGSESDPPTSHDRPGVDRETFADVHVKGTWTRDSHRAWYTPINEIPREPPCVTCRTPTRLSDLTLGGRCRKCADEKRREFRDAVRSVKQPKQQPLRQCAECRTWHPRLVDGGWCWTCEERVFTCRQLPQVCPAPRPQPPPPKPIMRVTANVEAGPVEACLRRAKDRYPTVKGLNAMQRFNVALDVAIANIGNRALPADDRQLLNKARSAIPFGYPRNDHNAMVWFDRLIEAAQKHGA